MVIADDEELLKGLTADAEGSPELEGPSGDGDNELGSLGEVGTPSAVWVPLEGLLTEVGVVAGFLRVDSIKGSRALKVNVGGSTSLKEVNGIPVKGLRGTGVPNAGPLQWHAMAGRK